MDKLNQIAIAINETLDAVDTIDDQVLARCIGTMIFDIPMTRSGYISTSLVDEYGYRPSIAKCCLEHFHSRQQSGYKLIAMRRDGCGLSKIIEFLREATMAHLTTSAENIKLSAIQNHPLTRDLTWQKQYELAGIELIEDVGTMPRKLQNKLKKAVYNAA